MRQNDRNAKMETSRIFHPYAGMVLDDFCYAVILTLTNYLSI